MAIFKQVVQVNNGNTGWTRQNVLESLEQVFANLGWHSGTARTGLIKSITPPNYSGTNPGWYTTGQIPAISALTKNDKTWTVTNSISNVYSFSQTTGDGSQTGNNIDIICNQGDILTFNITTPNDPFYIVWENTNGYIEGTEIDGDYSQFSDPGLSTGTIILDSNNILNIPNAQGVTNGTITWNTNDVLNGTYYYVSGSNPNRKGKITINPNRSYCDEITLYNLAGGQFNNWWAGQVHRMYFDYTVPASGSRSAATFRVYRNENGRISDVNILNADQTFGWTDGEVFTIPGTAIGGTSPTHDIVFAAVRTNTNPTLHVTNIGAGTEFYQKNLAEGWGILNLLHDSSKKYGRTLYSFQIIPDRPNEIAVNSGTEWIFANTRSSYEYLNYAGPGRINFTNYDYRFWRWNTPGYFYGITGVDINNTYPSITTESIGYDGITRIGFCRGTNPTSYPLSIRVYRAQSPQDTNFAIIQFTQTVNENVETYGTFFLHKGTQYGQGIWDLNKLFQGGMTFIYPSNPTSGEEIIFDVRGQMATGYLGYTENNRADSRARIREALYGYERDTYALGSNGTITRYQNNIYTDLSERPSNAENPANVIYYRRSESDGLVSRPGKYQYDSSSDYYRVIKGIPMCSSWIPQPYYLPDDFTLVQFAFGPGETDVRTGDTITISPSEKYEVVNSTYSKNVSVPGIGSATRGIAFCARIV